MAEPSPTTPPPDPPTPPSPKPRRVWAWVFGLLPILLVAGVIVAYLKWGPATDGGGYPGAATTADPSPANVVVGRDYYVFIKTIELYPTRPDGKNWDAMGGAPDIAYSLVWQDLSVYDSPTRDNTLIGVWDPITIDLAEALPMIGEGKIELASTLNQGAIINVTPEATLAVQVTDRDTTGMDSDEAGRVVLRVDELLQGDNVFTFEASDTNAIKRLILGTTDTSQPVKNLIEALSQP